MPRFETPDPVALVLELTVADVRVVSAQRTDTVVEVRPRDETNCEDVVAAEQTRIDQGPDRLLIKTAHRWRSWSPFSDGGGIEVRVELPAGSRLRAQLGMGALSARGPLAECRVKTGLGDVGLEQASQVTVTTGAGDLRVERLTGDGELSLSTGSGEVWVGEVRGRASVKNSNGPTHVHDLEGELRVSSANGDITVERCRGALTAKTANGDVRLSGVGPGAVDAQTGCGSVEIGIRSGTAAWLDLHTSYGHLDNRLAPAQAPEPDEERVEIHARSGFGDVVVYRRQPEGALAPTPTPA